jgi:ribosomal protein S12 methylthiotransferase accessory factor
MDDVVGLVDGSKRFHGLTPTNMQLDGLEKHQRLIESYRKLHAWRAERGQIGGPLRKTARTET